MICFCYSIAKSKKGNKMNHNPLFNLNEKPNFSNITAENVRDFFLNKIKKSEKMIDEVVALEDPTWDQVFKEDLEIDTILARGSSLISHYRSVNHSDEIEEVYKECLPLLIESYNKSSQNKELFSVYEKLSKKELTSVQRAIITKTIKGFKDSGIDLPKEKQKEYNKLDQKITELSTKFSENILKSQNEWKLLITNKEELKGLPDSVLDSLFSLAKSNDQEGYMLSVSQPYYSSVMTYLEDRNLRKELFTAYNGVASDLMQDSRFDNEPLLKEIVLLKNKKVKLIGYDNYVEYSLSNKMANSMEEIEELLYSLKDKTTEQGKKDYSMIKEYALKKDNITDFSAWDMFYYLELYKNEKLNINSEEIKEYFPVEKVKSGFFWLVNELYGIEFKKEELEGSYNKHVEYYSVYRNGEKVSSVLMDLFSRDKKRGGAWMSTYQNLGEYKDVKNIPVAFVTCNFYEPTDKNPSLLRFDDVETFFHEMGHALHHMLTVVDEPSAAGINGVAWDAVELPSQFMEYFCIQPEVIEKISGHYKTGETLSAKLLEDIKTDSNLFISLVTLKQIEFSLADLEIYRSPEKDPYDVLYEIKEKVSVVYNGEKDSRFLNVFSHIFAGGYSAGYYGYKWADVLSADIFETFEENGVICKETAKRFLDTILSQGGSKDINEMFIDFKGRKPKVDALIKYSGI